MGYAGNSNTLGQRGAFERDAEELQAWANSYLATTSWDVRVRGQYQAAIRAAMETMRGRARSGEITWEEATEELQQTRNDLLLLMRAKTSPIGLAIAGFLKKEGKTLNELIARYAVRRFGEGTIFDALSQAQKDQVYADIVAAAGRSNANVDAVILRVGRLSRGLIVLSMAVSIYEIATSPQPVQTAEKEAALTASGIGGGIAGGALAGLACGPGAPVCVTLGAFVGGALAVLGAGMIWGH